MTTTTVRLPDAVTTVLDAERTERPEFADRPDRDVIDQVRDELGIGNTAEIDGWGDDIVTPDQADAYRAVLTATDDDLALAVAVATVCADLRTGPDLADLFTADLVEHTREHVGRDEITDARASGEMLDDAADAYFAVMDAHDTQISNLLDA